MRTRPLSSSLEQLRSLQTEQPRHPVALPQVLSALGLEDLYQGPLASSKNEPASARARLAELRSQRRKREAGTGAMVSTCMALALGLGVGAAGSALLFITVTFGAVLFVPCWMMAKLAGESAPKHLEEKRLDKEVKNQKHLAEQGVDLSLMKMPENKDALRKAIAHLGAISVRLEGNENTARAAIEAFGRIFEIAAALEQVGRLPRAADLAAKRLRLRALEQQMAQTKRPLLRESLRAELRQVKEALSELEALKEDVEALQRERDLLVLSLATLNTQVTRLSAESVHSGRGERVRLKVEEATNVLADLIESQAEVQELSRQQIRRFN